MLDKYKIKILADTFSDIQNLANRDNIARFCYQSKTHLALSFLIGSKHNGGISLEEIFQTVDRRIASRSTIQRVLDTGIKTNFFEKNKSKEDGRVQLYRLAPLAVEFLKDWIKSKVRTMNSK
ncbi:MAG: hypothetical protein CBE14_003645 [Rickettsiales bacterium TMED254]|nr:MAG: hypothetical protein CBE14_003645 [Rickettsiales bacterium TMED254]|tara:strand:- start:317 stop:682 length:366 start_codon:yes stop_codon:yes gene_type:complete